MPAIRDTRRLIGISTTTTVDQYTAEAQNDAYHHDDGKITEIREQPSGQTDQSLCFEYAA
ncbi:hypothetical protein [Streptomyces collinus]|uniref:hypothetical protein n=1 Tax=Streptomyces collinus TaxID=42684 RepID=UPI00369F2174